MYFSNSCTFLYLFKYYFQFHDGVYLVLLMGLLEGYFVPLYSFHLTPTSFDQKVSFFNIFEKVDYGLIKCYLNLIEKLT